MRPNRAGTDRTCPLRPSKCACVRTPGHGHARLHHPITRHDTTRVTHMYSSVRVPVVLARSCALSVDGCVRTCCMHASNAWSVAGRAPRLHVRARVRSGPVHACSAPCARGACSLARVSGRARTDADRRDRGVTCASRRGAGEGRTASWPG
jgi:hypothetical protein